MRISSLSLRLRHLLLGTSALTGFALASTAQAGQPGLPTSGVVTVGSATIAQPSANQLNITTGTNRTVIDWQSFSIGNGNKVAIQQPGANSITVNEVTGSDPSQIFGDLSSNGRVVLANPNGIWFGPNSHVDVAGLVASTATLSADAKKAFAAGGRLSLDVAGNPTASIVNDGHITIAGEGLAALVAPGVRNNGVIEATLGSVTLASGETSTLDFYGDGLVSLAVTSPVQALAIGPDGKPFTATIESKGKIAAQHVLVTADVVKGVVDNSINMSGVVEAKGVTVSGGDIVLDGGEGDVTVSGTLDVTSQQATGGTVQVTGGTVTVAATAKVDASGAKGGGTIQIGGGPHGGGTLKHATNVLVQGGSAILANATSQGDGGTISIWSDESTTFGGSIEAKGAGIGGNGGWVETSGHLLSLAGGTVDTTAPFGTTGTWLLDPFLVDIIHSGSTDGSASTTSYTPSAATTITDADINFALGSSNVTIQTSGAGGSITVEPTAALAWSSSSTLTLATTVSDATGSIAINGTIAAANGGLILSTSGTVSQTAAIGVDLLDLTGAGGTFNLATVSNSVNVLAANTGTVNLNDNGLSGAGLTIGNLNGTTGITTTGTTTISATQAGGITNTSPISASGLSLTENTGTINLDAVVTVTGGGLFTINTNGSVAQTGTITAGSLELIGTGSYSLNSNPNDIGTLAADAGSVALNNGGNPLTIGTAGGTTGLTTTGGFSLVNLSQSVPLVLAGNVMVGTGGIDLSVATTGAPSITIGAPVVAISAAASEASIVLGPINGTMPGAQSLTVNAGIQSQITLAGDIGDVVQLGSLTVGTTGGEVFLPSNVSTMGTQSYTGAVMVGNGGITTTNISAIGDVQFASTLDGELGTETVNINAQGAVNFGGAIGSQVGLAALNVIASSISAGNVILQLGTLSFTAGVIALNTAVTTSGDQIYAGPLTVAGLAGGTQVTLTGGNIQFTSAVAGVTGSEQLTINASGPVQFGGPINNLSALSVTGTSIALAGSVSTIGEGNQTYTGPVTFSSNVPVILQSGGSIIFTSTIDGVGPLALDAMSSVSLGGSVGANTPGGLSSLQISGSTITLAGAVTTSGPFEADFASGGFFVNLPGASITSGANVIIDAVGSNAASEINIDSSITAPGIYLLAADHGTGASGMITLSSGEGGGTLLIQNTAVPDPNNPSALMSPMRADTIFYAGPGGTINIAASTIINGGAANIALVADTLTIGTSGTPSSISTTGHVILAPGATDGLLTAGTPLPYTLNGTGQSSIDVIDTVVSGGDTAANITVGGGTGIADLTNLSFLSGSSGAQVGQLEIGLVGNSANMTVSGAVNFLTGTSLNAGNVVVATGATVTNNVAGTNLPLPLAGLSISASNSVTLDGTVNIVGVASIGVGPGGTFTQAAGVTLSSNAGVVVYENSTAGGATLNVNGSIQAPEIYLLASDHQSNQAGQIALGGTADLVNTNTVGDMDGPNIADTILYAGPGGGITMASGAQIQGGITNIALVSDTLTLSSPILSTFGRLIVAPASTDGELTTDGTVALPDPFTATPSRLLDFAAPAGVTSLATIGVGTGAGTYQLSQATLNALTGVPVVRDGATVMSVARFQIGLPGSSNVENLAGPISFGTEVSDFAAAFNFASNAAISIPSTSVQTFDTDGDTDPTTGVELTTPSGVFFIMDLNSTATRASLTLPAGASVSVPGNIQIETSCFAAVCNVVPTVSIGGALTAGAAFYEASDFGDVVTLAPTASIISNGVSTAGGIEFSVGSLLLGGTLTSAAGVIDFDTNVTLQGSTVSINSGGADIDFDGTLQGVTSRQNGLVLTAGSTGNINFDDLVGNGGLQLGAVTIVSADNVTGPALNSTSLAGGTPEFEAASFSAGSSSNPIAGAFTMPGGLSTNPGTNALTNTQTSGAIFINAAGAVTIGTINATIPTDDLGVSARGADISSSTANTTGVVGNGGSISITGSSLTLADVTARGGEAKSGSVAVTNGGSGGTIFLDATSGNVTVLGGFGDPGVTANGGQSTLTSGGVGGNAGSILIDAANGNVTIPGAYANGGGVLGGVGGNAGSVIIDAVTISLERALAIGGDTQATGTGAGGGTGGLVNLTATGTNAIEITLGGNSSDLSGSATASTFGTLSARGGEVGVTNVFGADQGGTVTGAGGSVLIEGAQGAALGGLIELVNTTVAGGTAVAGTLSGGANVIISASGAANEGGLVEILGSFAAADNGVEGLRLGATNGIVDVTGSVGIKGGNALNQLVLTGNAGAITIIGDVVTNTLSELRTSGSLTIDGDLKLNTYTTPLGNTVVLDFPGQAGGSSSGSGNAVSIAGTFLSATPLMLGGNAITLIGTTVFDSSATNAALTLGSVDGAFSLTLNAGTGSVTTGTIGAQTALTSLTITGGSINLGSVTTTGAQTYTGPTSLSGIYSASVFDVVGATTLAGTSTVTAATTIFGGTIDGTTSGGQSLTITAPTTVELDGAIGGNVPLDNFTLSAGGINGSVPSIFVTGTQMINLTGAFYSGDYTFADFINTGSMILSGDTVITATAGDISIGGTVNGAHALSLIDLTGTITIDGIVGGSSALTSLTLTSNNAIVLGGTITTTGAQSYTGPVSLAGTIVGGSFAVNGATSLTGAAAVTTSGNITFGGTVDGAQSLVLNAGSAAAAIQGATGAQVALGGLAITAGTITVGNVATSGAQSYNGPLILSSVSTLQSAGGGLTFGSTITGTQSLTLSAGTGNISFDGTLSTQADPTALTILSGDNVTVFNNSTLWVTNFLGTITGAFTFGNHSLDSDDVVSITAGSVDGRVTTTSATGSVTIDADSATGIINGDTVSVTTTGAVSEQITGGAVSVDSGSFSGTAVATRSANIAASGDVSANVTVSGGSASVSGANVSGSVTASGLAQISATENVSADVTGGSVAISAPSGTVSGAVTATGGGITIAAGNVSSTIVAQGGGSVDVTASGSITGSVKGGTVNLTAPVVSENVDANSANITADSSNITGTIGGNDAASVVAASSNVTQTVLGATREVANGGDNGTGAGDDQGGDATTADGETTDDKKKKAKDKGAVYDYANQYIDNLISGKPAH